ncbi:hypothetical protein [Pseudomonas sp. GV071]|uniref:hypothetical protein n=1 Tax=Pseudomonas sp. GV071 TaxID=2135754 RepID=UPI000D36364A|nr:hypothetical protein [Pseudomonas sp. GV071]PTQ70285.1 hypothetical protein C8K61_1067 [Pseudomonas sp. GV071]
MASTLLLDQTAWDLVLDASGDIALANQPYSIAQDVACAVRTFIGECWYDQSLGMPYFQKVLGQLPPPSFIRQQIIDAAMTVPDVVQVEVQLDRIEGRGLSGLIKIIDTDGIESGVTF